MKTVSRIRNGSIKKSDGVIFRMAAATTDSSLDGFGASSSPAPLASAPSSRSRVLLPGPNRTYSDFAHEVGAILRDAIGDRIVPEKSAERNSRRLTYKGNPANQDECFLCFRFGVFGRIRKSAKTGKFVSSVFFEPIDHQQAVTELERWIEFGLEGRGRVFVAHSMTPPTSKTLLSSGILRSYLPRVDRVLEYSIPIKLLTKFKTTTDPFDLGDDQEVKSMARWKAHNAKVDEELGEIEFGLPEGAEPEQNEYDPINGVQFRSAPLYKTLCIHTVLGSSDDDCRPTCMMTGGNGAPEEPTNGSPTNPPVNEANDAKAAAPTPKEIKPEVESSHLLKLEPGFGQYMEANGEWVYYYCDRYLGFAISAEEAKTVLDAVFEEFKLESQPKANAIARLLTPHCQGLMGWRKRSPLWVIIANQPRSGKDYLAMIAPIVHSQLATQDPPLEYEEEVKRRITTALMAGRRFMHFANCRSDLDNPSLEAAVTTEYWTDRAIGTSNEETVPNEIMFSLSYNGYLPLTRDLAARMCVIHIFNSRPKLNSHKFQNNLHAMLSAFEPPAGVPNPNTYICRRNVLAALDALVDEWVKQKAVLGNHHTSFPEWAHYVGGIMVANKLGDPTKSDESIESMTTSSDWEDAFLQLAKDVCAKGGGKYYSSRQLYEKFIQPNQTLPAYSAYDDYLVNTDHKNPETAFHSALSKYLNGKLPFPTIDGTDQYRVERYPKPTVPQYRFSTKAISTTASPSTTSSGTTTEDRKDVPLEKSAPVPTSATEVAPDTNKPVAQEEVKPASSHQTVPVPFPD